MTDALFDADALDPEEGEQAWAGRPERSLRDELRRRKARLESRNPLRDPDGYLTEFQVLVALEAHLRDRAT